VASVLDAALARRSSPKVTDAAPDDAALVALLEGAGRVADHAALRPWRVIALRGAARERLGAALARGGRAPRARPRRSSRESRCAPHCSWRWSR
jgi:nitroreductase